MVPAWRTGFWHALWNGDAEVVLRYAGLSQAVVWAGATHETEHAVVIGARERSTRSRWGWWRAGQQFGPEGARAVLGRQWKKRAAGWWLEVAARAMGRWARVGSCSGLALADVGDHYVVTRVQAPRVSARRRRQLAGEQGGIRPSRQGLWRAVRAVDVRVRRPGGVQVLVRWQGSWADSWEPLVSCSRALRTEAKALLVAAKEERATRRQARAAERAAATERRQRTAATSRQGRRAEVERRRTLRGTIRGREAGAATYRSQSDWVRQALSWVGSLAVPEPTCVSAVLEAARGQLRGVLDTGWSPVEARALRDRALLTGDLWHGRVSHAKGANALWEDEAKRLWEAVPDRCDRGMVWVWAACRSAGRAWGGIDGEEPRGVTEPPDDSSVVTIGGVRVQPPAVVERTVAAKTARRDGDRGAQGEGGAAPDDASNGSSSLDEGGSADESEAGEASAGAAARREGGERLGAKAGDRKAAGASRVRGGERLEGVRGEAGVAALERASVATKVRRIARPSASARDREAARASARAAEREELARMAQLQRRAAVERAARRRRRAHAEDSASEEEGEDAAGEAVPVAADDDVARAAPGTVRRRVRRRGCGVPVAEIAGQEDGGWSDEMASLALAWSQAVGFDIDDLGWEVARLLGSGEWTVATLAEQQAIVDFESFAWRRTCAMAEAQWDAACGEAGVTRGRSRAAMLELAGRSSAIQRLFVTWLREFNACELVRVEAGGEWRRDREWLYSRAWCDPLAVGNVAMRAACWLLRERLVVAWAVEEGGAAVSSVRAMASVVQPASTSGSTEVEWAVVHGGPWEESATVVLLEAGGLGGAWAWLPDKLVANHGDACACQRGRPGPLTDWGICPGCDCELVRCGGCGLVRCSANCGVGMHGAPEVADREVMVQLLQPDPHWTDTIGL